jgi:hypothetical protein
MNSLVLHIVSVALTLLFASAAGLGAHALAVSRPEMYCSPQ